MQDVHFLLTTDKWATADVFRLLPKGKHIEWLNDSSCRKTLPSIPSFNMQAMLCSSRMKKHWKLLHQIARYVDMEQF